MLGAGLFVDAKADLSLVVPKLGTPLATAITRGQFQAVKTILARHSLKLEPISPLFVAVEAKQNAVELVKTIVRFNIDYYYYCLFIFILFYLLLLFYN